MDVRLPKYVVPKHYDVAVNVDLKHLKYNGTSTAEFELKQATTYVYIHANIIKITKASIRNKGGSMLQVSRGHVRRRAWQNFEVMDMDKKRIWTL